MKLLSTTALITILYISPAPLLAEVITKETHTYYTMDAKNIRGIHAQMLDNNGTSERGKIKAATTTYNFVPKITFRKTRNGCIANIISITVNITYRLPRLKTTRNMLSQERRRWKILENKIRVHEYQHGKIAKQGAKNMHLKLNRAKKARNCEILQKKINNIIKITAEQYAKVQQDFDKRKK